MTPGEMARELVPCRVEQVAYVRELQADVARRQAALDAACKALVAGVVPDGYRVVGGLTEGYLIVEYPWGHDAAPA